MHTKESQDNKNTKQPNTNCVKTVKQLVTTFSYLNIKTHTMLNTRNNNKHI